MKTFYYLLLAVLLSLAFFAQDSEAQISGTITIPGTNYPTIKVAVDSLNAYGVGSGGVIFNVSAGYTENITAPLILRATGTSSDQIIFQKSGIGANPLITRTDTGTYVTSVLGGQGDAIVIIQGSDYVTFDAIDVTATNQKIEYGYYLRKKSPTDGCKNVTIQYAVVTMTKGTSGYVLGIYSSNNDSNSSVSSSTGITVTSIGGRSENIKIIGNTIQNVHSGIYSIGYAHSTSPYNFQDTNFIIGQSGAGNTIQNFGGGSATTAYGVCLSYQKSPNISYNTINNAAGGGTTATYSLYGITSGASGNSGDCYYNNNIITLSVNSTYSYCISDASLGNSKTINNNTFSFGTYNSTITSMIYACSATNNITVSGNQTSGIINNTSTSVSNMTFYTNTCGGQTGGTEILTNNTISNITVAGLNLSASFYGFCSNTSSSQNRICYGNTFSNITVGGGSSGNVILMYLVSSNSNQIYNNTIHTINTTSSSIFTLLYFGGTNATVFENNIYNITTSGSSIMGIYNSASSGNCYKNRVYNLTVNNTSPTLYGIDVTSGSGNYVYNNFISDLKTPIANSSNPIAGINIAAGTSIGLYYNTIYLNATSTGATFGSSGIYSSTTPTVDMRNNIIVNNSTPKGTGLTTAYRRSSTTLTTYASTSNNNCFYSGVPSASRLIYYDGTNSDQTIAGYKSRVVPRDNLSFTENPPFENISITPYNLHLDTATATQCESGGTPISSPVSITTDYDGDTRNVLIPDVGADEFSGIPNDFIGPSIIYTPLVNTSSTSNRAFNGVMAGDASGVNFTSGTAPRVYYKKSTDANTYAGNTSANNGWKYVETATGSSPFDFTIDYSLLYGSGTVSLGDSIQYFVVAQDLKTTPNVGINAGVFNSQPSSVALTSGAFPITGMINRYVILQGFSNTVLVGTGQTFTTLTGTGGLFDAINKGIVTGDLTVNITSDIWEPGTIGLNQTNEKLNYNIRIVPDTLVLRVIAGNYNGGLIRLNGADRITIDGSYNGSGQYLIFRNRYNSTSAYTINLLNGASYDTVKNCIIQGVGYPIYFGNGTLLQGNLNNVFDNVEVCDADSANLRPTYGFYIYGTNTIGTKILNSKIHNVSNYGIYNYGSGGYSDSNLTVKNCDIYRFGTYGIYLYYWGGSNNLIEGNRIYQDTANFLGSSNYGIYIYNTTGNSNLTIRNNKIFNLCGTTSAALIGIYCRFSAVNMNVYIYNNVISLGGSTTSTGQIDGITYNGFAQNNCYIYYNSIYIGGTNVTGVNSNGIYKIGPINDFFVYDNSVHNARSNNTGIHYAYYYSNTSTTNWLQNYNDFYVSGTGGVLTYYAGTDYNTLEGWKSVSLKDTNSLNSDPMYYLNIPILLMPQAGSPLQNAGFPIPGILTDILDSNRNITNPSIGAYEIGIDLTGPAIVYTPLTHSSSLTGRSFTATISDYSDVDTASGTRPRVYFKKITDANTYAGNTNTDNGWKWKEAENNSSPFSFTIDYSIINGGSVSYNDTIQYFVVAQDLVTLPNVGINSGVFASVPGSVNLTSSAFPLTGTIRYYKIASGYSGTVSVGEGQFYTTLTDTNGLFQAINSGLISSDLTALITSDITEPGYFALNQTIEELFYTVTIKPDSAVNRTISGSYAGGLIRLNGADRITFDGRYNGSGNYLTFINTNAVANSAVFLISSLGTGQGAVNNTIRNCNISAGSNTLTTSAVFSGGTVVGTGGADNDNLKIIENNISKCYYGVNIFGTSTGLHDSLEISDNIIGSPDSASYVRYYGLYLSYMDSSVVSGNEIFNMIGNNAKYGMYMGSNISNNRFSGNKIHTFSQFSTGAYTTAGMYFSSSTGAVNNQIDNNVIYDLYQYGSTTNTYNPGIRIVGGDGYKIYNNSISFTGAFGSTTAGCYCICLMVTTSSTNMDIRNNIFYNARTGNVPRSYTIYTVGGTTFTNLDYNIYYSTGTYFGVYNGTVISDFTGWKTASGKDMYSLSGDPVFTSSTNLMPDISNLNCWNENGKGIQIPSINSDFNGNPRSTLAMNGPTDIGAFEFTPSVNPPEMTQTGVISGDSTTSYAQSQKTYLDITWGASLNNKRENNRESVNNVRRNTGNTRTSTLRYGDFPAVVTVKKYSGMTPPDTIGIPAPLMSKGFWYVDADADPGSPVTVKIYWGDEELGSITDTSKLILAMYDMKSRVWLPFSRGIGDGYSVVDHLNKTITVSGLTRLDSVCYALTSSDYPLKRFALDLTLLIEGLYYDGGNPPNIVPDTVKAELRTPGTYTLIETMTIPLDQYGRGYGYTVSTLALPDQLFWITIKHRNALETWCDTTAVKPMFSRITGTAVYDFTTVQSQAYGGNMVLKNGKWCIFSGDIIKDGFIDIYDMSALDNDVYNYASGYIVTDLNGDLIADGSDMAILDNNLVKFLQVQKPNSAPGFIKAINKIKKVTR